MIPCTRAHETPIENLLAEPDSAESVEFLAHCDVCETCSAELARYRNRSRKQGSRGQLLAIGGSAAIAGLLLVWLGSRTAPQTSDHAESNPPTAVQAGAAPGVQPAAQSNSASSNYSIAPGERAEITFAPEHRSKPVAFNLKLGEASTDGEPRPVKIVSTDGRVMELQGALTEDRMSAAVEIPGEFLSPGRYMVEIRTTELTHFPIRRYVIVVRPGDAERQ